MSCVRASLYFVMAVGLSQNVHAQAGTEALSFTPALHAHWSIIYQDRSKQPAHDGDAGLNSQTGKSKNKQVMKENFEIGDQASYMIRSYADGSVETIYLVNKVAYISDPPSKGARPELMSSFSGVDVLFSEKYPGVGWVSQQYFVDEQTISNRKCLHYRQEASAPKPGKAMDDQGSSLSYDPNFTSSEREAWMDEETKLPYAFHSGTVNAVYEHLPPTGEKIVLPPAVAKAVRYYNGYDN